jgi:hypothetical protein
MKPKKDPIKPIKSFTKKPNFKKEKLDTDYFSNVDLSVFRSPGVYTREVDISTIQMGQGELDHVSDIEYLQSQLLRATRIPAQYLGSPESPIVTPQEIRTQQELQRLFGSPIGISSRQRQNTDGSLDLLGYDLVNDTPTSRGRLYPLTVQGGEQMMYEASTWMTPICDFHKKKSIWGRLKEWVSNIYKKWKLAE